jgi:hypothetical protein
MGKPSSGGTSHNVMKRHMEIRPSQSQQVCVNWLAVGSAGVTETSRHES